MKTLLEKRFIDLYGKPMTVLEGQQFQRSFTNSSEKGFRNLKYDKGDKKYDWARANKSAQKIEKLRSENRKKKAKEWLYMQDVVCWKRRGKHGYSNARYEMVDYLKSKLNLTFEEMSEILTQIVGKPVKEHGLAYIYRN